MINNSEHVESPKFYGATTIGERGQVVIPAQARTDLNIIPGSKLLVFGGPHGNGLMIVKPEDIAEFVAKAMTYLNEVNGILKDSGS